MKFLLFISIFLLSLSSYSQTKSLDITTYSTTINNAGVEGVQVQDPSTTNPSDNIILKNGFFEFWFDLKNSTSTSIVITHYKLELIKDGLIIRESDFISQAHVPHLPPNGVGDIKRRFFAHLDPDSKKFKSLGGQAHGKFFMDDLIKDEDTGLFLYTARVTFYGFLTSTTLASGNDPFLNDQGPYKQTVELSVR